MEIQRTVRVLVVASVLLTIWASLNLNEPLALGGMRPERAAAAPPSQGPISAQRAPSASILAPSAAIGDFGASRGNVWDMDSTADIVWTQEPFPLEELDRGTIVRGRIPEGEDLAVAFYASSASLPSRKYHHLIYKLRIAAEGSCRTNGRVIYAKSWPNWLGSQVFTHAILPHHPPMTLAGCAYGKFCTYYMDLSSNQNHANPTWFSNPPPWPNDAVKAFGMWPHERWVNCSGGPNYFDLDFVYLTGNIVARAKDGYRYTIRWRVSDPDGGTIVSTLRYRQVAELRLPSQSPVCNSSNFGTQWTYLGRRTTDVGTTARRVTYNWNLSGSNFQDGRSYYVCIRVDDGTSKRYVVSSAPVIRVPLSPYFSNE